MGAHPRVHRVRRVRPGRGSDAATTRQPRFIHIYNLRFTRYDEPVAHFRIGCTKGTYVRTVAHEMGQKVGCGGHLLTLRRLASGKFDVADAHTLDTILGWSDAELERNVIPYLKLKNYE